MSANIVQKLTGTPSWMTVDPLLTLKTVSVLLVSTLFFFFLKLEWRRYKYSKLIPSKTPRPFDVFGNLHDMQFKESERNGYSFNAIILQTLNGYCQIFRRENLCAFWISYFPFVIAQSANAVESIISSTKYNEKAWLYYFLHPWLGTGLLTSAGAKWKSRRKLLTPSFHFDILRDFLPVFNEKSQLLVRLLQQETTKDYTDIVLPITLCSLDIICETTLGVSIGVQENKELQYVKSVAAVSDITFERMLKPKTWSNFLFSFTETGKEYSKHLKMLHAFTNSVIRDKKQKLLNGESSEKKRKALMDLLLEHHIKTKTLSEEDIREEVDTFTFEGHDTTSMGMTWALYLLGLHRDAQDKVHEELDRLFGDDLERPATNDDLKDMKYFDCVLKECQRLYPSVPMIGRQAKEDTTICGIKVPKGSVFCVNIFMLHRNETVFPDSEKFDPDRFLPENCLNRHPYAYIPFSAGPRNCIGQRFALMEEKVVLSTILRHFKIESLDARDKVPATPDLVLRPANPVRIRIRPRDRH